MAALELRVPPLLLVVLFGAAMFGVAGLIPSLDFRFPAAILLALVLVTLGTAVAAAGVVEFRRHGTTVTPLAPESSSKVVRTGVYAVSRNPMYLGFFLWLAATAMYIGNLAAYALLPLFVAYMNCFQIIPEEKALLEKFGEPFGAYMKTVRRWI